MLSGKSSGVSLTPEEEEEFKNFSSRMKEQAKQYREKTDKEKVIGQTLEVPGGG